MKLDVYFFEPAENELFVAVTYYNMQSYGIPNIRVKNTNFLNIEIKSDELILLVEFILYEI